MRCRDSDRQPTSEVSHCALQFLAYRRSRRHCVVVSPYADTRESRSLIWLEKPGREICHAHLYRALFEPHIDLDQSENTPAQSMDQPLEHRFGHDARGLLGGAGEQQATDLVLAREVFPRR